MSGAASTTDGGADPLEQEDTPPPHQPAQHTKAVADGQQNYAFSGAISLEPASTLTLYGDAAAPVDADDSRAAKAGVGWSKAAHMSPRHSTHGLVDETSLPSHLASAGIDVQRAQLEQLEQLEHLDSAADTGMHTVSEELYVAPLKPQSMIWSANMHCVETREHNLEC